MSHVIQCCFYTYLVDPCTELKRNQEAGQYHLKTKLFHNRGPGAQIEQFCLYRHGRFFSSVPQYRPKKVDTTLSSELEKPNIQRLNTVVGFLSIQFHEQMYSISPGLYRTQQNLSNCIYVFSDLEEPILLLMKLTL